MASFTDSPYQFHPLIETTPVDAMVKVGMLKQQQYDEGVQKIQGWIDNIAGLDVVKPEHQQYLQGKMNSLETQLKGVASADFSKQQLVNSVGGVTSSIVKDPIVQNAVYSTANYRKGLADMEEAKKNGTLAPGNEYDYRDNFNKWYTNKDLKTPFTSTYTPFYDIEKHTKDFINALKPDGFTYDQIFVTGTDGKPLIDKRTGQPVLSTYMTRLKQEGLFPDKVKMAIDQVFSDPRVAQQLQIDGKYTFRGESPEQLAQSITQQKSETLGHINDTLNEITLKKNTTKNADQLALLNDQESKIKDRAKEITTSFDSVVEAAYTNPDYVRGLKYKDMVKNNYSRLFTSVKTDNEYLSNPGWQSNFEMIKEGHRVAEFNETKSIERQRLANEADYHSKMIGLASLRASGKLKGTGIADANINETTQGFEPASWDVVVQGFDNDYTNAGKSLAASTDELIFTSILNNGNNPALVKRYIDNGMSKEQAMDFIIRNTAKMNNESPDAFRARWSDRAVKYIEAMNPTDKESNRLLHDALSNFQAAKQNFGNIAFAKQQIDKEAPATFGHIDYNSAVIPSIGGPIEKGINQLIGNALTSSSVDANLQKRGSAINKYWHTDPTRNFTFLTGKASEDEGMLTSLANIVGDRITRKQAIGENPSAILDIINSQDKIKNLHMQVSKGPDGNIVPKIVAYDKNGEQTGNLVLAADEAEQFGLNVNSLYQPDAVRFVQSKMAATHLNQTSYGDPTKIETYLNNDVLYTKNDFPNLVGMSGIDAKANIKEQGGKYYPIIYIRSDDSGLMPPIQLHPVDDVNQAIDGLKNISAQTILGAIAKNKTKK